MGEYTSLGLAGGLERKWCNALWRGARRAELNKIIAEYVRRYNYYAAKKGWRDRATARKVERQWWHNCTN